MGTPGKVVKPFLESLAEILDVVMVQGFKDLVVSMESQMLTQQLEIRSVTLAATVAWLEQVISALAAVITPLVSWTGSGPLSGIAVNHRLTVR